MAKKERTSVVVIEEYKVSAGKQAEARQAFEDRKVELELNLEKLQGELSKHQVESALDITDEALSKEVALKQEITRLELTIAGLNDRLSRVNVAPEVSSLAVEAVDLAREEAIAQYKTQEQALLDDIENAKFAYLNAIVAFRNGQQAVAEKVRETARQVGRSNGIEQKDLPHLREIHWGYTTHPEADGIKYGLSAHEISQAINHGITTERK
ncbi:hypothetical protein ACH0CI_26780 [Priestia sp. 179-F W1.4 NHS]|uniref:hypothetical protein n=1 Tax=Priestia sp. 179-F W1.4 NHS TaxID=3374296 RepID=UPI00387A51C2